MKTKAILLRETGTPDRLAVEDVPLDPPGPGEVRLRHTAIGVNFSETQFRRGIRKMPLPGVPGAEGAGVIEALGPDVTGFKEGERVAYCGAMGSYAEHRNVPAGVLVKLPAAIADETAAATLLKGLTAWYLIRRTVRIEPGDTILYHAAAGGVGTILCQWAKHLGAQVIGTVGAADKKARALRNGCSAVIDYRDEDFVARVLEITDGKGVHVCYDSVARDTFENSMKAVAPFGYIVLFGNASGDVAPESYARIPLDRYFIHPTLPQYIADRNERKTGADELFQAIAAGHVEIDIPQRFPLAQAARAHEELEMRRTVGSSILVP